MKIMYMNQEGINIALHKQPIMIDCTELENHHYVLVYMDDVDCHGIWEQTASVLRPVYSEIRWSTFLTLVRCFLSG